MSASAATAVFAGPSLPASEVARLLPGARVEPPACRGDVPRLRDDGVETFLLIDGGFAHQLAVSPRELVEVLADGARVLGASSMGAIRAAECLPAGMQPVGAVAALYRLRVITDDDEVAVAVAPDRGFAPASVALVNVRFAVLAALRVGLLDRSGAAAVLGAAKGMHFSERLWPAIFAAAGIEPGGALRALAEATDVKRRDARVALTRLAVDCGEGLDPRAYRASAGRPLAVEDLPQRYTGHDPLLGRAEAELRSELPRWLLASGRYRRYWDSDPPAPSEVWARLEAERALEYELMHWHAVATWAGRRPEPGEPGEHFLDRARRLIAEAHGFLGWRALERDAPVHIESVREAADLLARARRNIASTSD